MGTDHFCGSGDGSYPSDCDVAQGLLQRARERGMKVGERSYAKRSCFPRAEKVKLLLLDVDGVLTDSSIFYTASGEEMKSFSTRDGFGIRLLHEAGIQVGIITARVSEAVARRARELKLDYIYQGGLNKIEAFKSILEESQIPADEIAYMGDDWLDLPLLTRVGFAATVADGAPEVMEKSHYITTRAGGCGAVRELCDLIIDAKGLHDTLLDKYMR